MKNGFRNFLIAGAIILAGAMAGTLMSNTPAPLASGCVGGNYANVTGVLPQFPGSATYVAASPIYYAGQAGVAVPASDTIKGTYVNDTFVLACGCDPRFITFSNDLYLASVIVPTVTPVYTAALYESSNGGATYNWLNPLTTYTVTAAHSGTGGTTTGAAADAATAVNATYTVNLPYGGNPFTNYMWVITGHASDTALAVMGVTMRQ